MDTHGAFSCIFVACFWWFYLLSSNLIKCDELLPVALHNDDNVDSFITLSPWVLLPGKLRVTFLANASCDEYPMEGNSPIAITLVCNSVELRAGEPLKLKFLHEEYTPWPRTWSIKERLYVFSESSKIEVKSINLHPGEPKDVLVCVEYSRSTQNGFLACIQYKLSVLVKYFNLRSELSYRIYAALRRISRLFDTKGNNTIIPIPVEHEDIIKDKEYPFLAEEGSCVLSSGSARVCGVEVSNNARLLKPFDPYSTTLYIKVNPCNDDEGDDVVITIPKQKIKGNIERSLAVSVNNSPLGALPLTFNAGKVCKCTLQDACNKPIILKTLNKRSGHQAIMLIRFLDEGGQTDEILSIYGSLGSVTFTNVEEIDTLGVFTSSDYRYRHPRFKLRRGFIREATVSFRANSSGKIGISVLDDYSTVFLNGVKIHSKLYDLSANDINLTIVPKHEKEKINVRLKSTERPDFRDLNSLLWPLYVTYQFLVLQNSEFVDSFIAYTFARLHFGLVDTVYPLSTLAHKLLIYVHDDSITSYFTYILLLEVCLIVLLFIMVIFSCLPTSFVNKVKSKKISNLPYVVILINYCNIMMLMFHILVYGNNIPIIYIMGHAVPSWVFRFISVLFLTVSYIMSLFIAYFSLRTLIQLKATLFDDMYKVSKYRKTKHDDIDTRWLVERNKIYKVTYRNVLSDSSARILAKEFVEVEVLQVNSISTRGLESDSNIDLFSIRTDIPGFNGMHLVAKLRLKDLELISLMRRSFRIWWLPDNIASEWIGNKWIANSFFLLSTLVDSLSIVCVALLNYVFGVSLSPTASQLSLKWSTLILAIVSIYSHHRRAGSKSNIVASRKLRKKSTIIQNVIYKSARTLALTLYIYLKSRSKGNDSFIPYKCLELIFLTWSFYFGFPFVQARNLLSSFKHHLGRIETVYLHLVSVYRYLCFLLYAILRNHGRVPHLSSVSSKMDLAEYSNMLCYSVPSRTCVTITDLKIVDAFRSVHRLRSGNRLAKYVYIHPSLYPLYDDVMPVMQLESCNIFPLGFKPLDSFVHDRDTSMPNSNYDEPGGEYKLRNLLTSKKNDVANACESGLHVIWRSYVAPEEEQNVERNISDNESVTSVVSAPEERVSDSIVRQMSTSHPGDERLLGILEWRLNQDYKAYNVRSRKEKTERGSKMPLYVSLGTINTPDLEHRTFPTLVTFDCKKQRITISDLSINLSEVYHIHMISLGSKMQKLTTVVCLSICDRDSEVIFEPQEEIHDDIHLTVLDIESDMRIFPHRDAIRIKYSSSGSVITITNEDFKVGRSYVLIYESSVHKSKVQLIYHGLSHDVLSEITIHLGMNISGVFDFVIWDSKGCRKRLGSVHISCEQEDTVPFGMKLEIMDAARSVDLSSHHKGCAYFTEDTFYFEDADSVNHATSAPRASTKCLKVHPSPYILGDNMSFLVPVTVVQRLKSKYDETIYRVIPHYDSLAEELASRVYKLNCALQYIQSELALAGKHRIASNTTKNAENETDGLPLVEFLSDYEYHHTVKETPEDMLREFIAATFTKESLMEYWSSSKLSVREFNNHFLTIMETIIIFCIGQLKEGAAILARKHEMVNSTPVKVEMQRFDLLISQGIAVETATSMMENCDRYKCYLNFPLTLRADDLHTRVNLGRVLQRLQSLVEEYHGHTRHLKYDPFIKAALTRHLTSNRDLRETLKVICHIITPIDEYWNLTLSNMYCFVRTTTVDSNAEDTIYFWIPCFISVHHDILHVEPSERHIHEVSPRPILYFSILALNCTLSNEPIDLHGGTQVMDSNIVITLHIDSISEDRPQKYLITPLIEDGTMVLRCHKRYIGFWKRLYRLVPRIKG